jgi:hypothetical protein
MEPYKSKSRKPSGVIGFKIADKAITVQFTNGAIYSYTYNSASKDVVEKMKALAIKQRGLSTFISQNKPLYNTEH